MKICTKCNIEKPKTDFHKDKQKSDGLYSSCSDCAKAWQKSWRESNPERVALLKKKWKMENREKQRRMERAYALANAEKISAYQAEYRKQNADSISAWQSLYYEKNRDEILEYHRVYAIENKEKIAIAALKYRQENKEEIAKAKLAYARANPEKLAAKGRERRAFKMKSGGSHTASDIHNIFESQRGLCATCETKLFKSGKKKFHADHIVPLVRGGSNDKYNMQCLCPTCNLKKNAMHPIEWAQKNGKLL